MSEHPAPLRLDVPRGPSAARFVRRALIGFVETGDPRPLLDDVLLATSELVTNAVMHTVGSISVAVWSTGGRWRVEVHDESEATPRVIPGGHQRIGGHGMQIVDSLATAWGVELRSGGKCCWFELLTDGRSVSAAG